MRAIARTGLFLLGVLAPWLAHAQIFMCKDASGRTITSDRPIPECADRAVREYGKSGNLKRDIPPPPTAEEKRLKLIQEEKEKVEALAAAEQKRSDRAIMARYRNEADIELSRKRSLDIVQEQVKHETASLATAEKQLKQAQMEIDAVKKKQAKPPADLVRRVEDADKSVSDSKKRTKDYEAELAQINAKFDETLKRYRELAGTAATAAPK